MKFSIAIGRSRRDVRWKNEEWSWSDFLDRIRQTHRTHETYAEYMAAKKPRQDEIKDVGGFVGGRLSGGRRQAAAVVCRQLVVLDIDYSLGNVWEDFKFLYGNAAAIYTTHKHSPETPRYRLVLPLDREVTVDEFIPIARRIAGTIGIELFDPTTYEPSRLMYWPSTSSDGVYEMEHQDGDWISADEVLASYRDWSDISEWPMSQKEQDIHAHNIKKQGDPLEKEGIVGAFCRTFDIDQAIEEYLSDVYEPCGGAEEGRYTYKGGTTSAGLVVYKQDGVPVFAYSHHGTDPSSGKLCNAFDLVRLHKFALLDEDCKEGTPGHKRPSYAAMRALAMKDKEVKYKLGSEKLAEAFADFKDFADTGEVGEVEAFNDEWLKEMDIDRQGKYVNTINNVALILDNDPNLKGCFGKDEFGGKKMVLRNLPWRKAHLYPYVKDTDLQFLCKYLEKIYGITGKGCIVDGFDTHIELKAFHPVKDYLSTLKWDGEPRLETLFVDYLGAEDTEYTRAATRKTFVAGVARIKVPGIKFDTMTVLIGDQGVGKSTLLNKMGKSWFSDSFGDVRTKEAAEQIQGVWLMEVGEMAAMNKADVDAIKLFLAKQDDSYRPAFGREVITRKREGIIIGSGNENQFLRDKTGNRRFWPILCRIGFNTKNIFKGELPEWYVDQVWAEAQELWDAGETLYMDEKNEETARIIQANHEIVDEREGLIAEYLDMPVPDNWNSMDMYQRKNYVSEWKSDELPEANTLLRQRISAAEVWVELFGGHVRDMTSANTKPIHAVLKRIKGWKDVGIQRVNFYGNQRSYARNRLETAGTHFVNNP